MNDVQAEAISSLLDATSALGTPHRLRCNSGFSHYGTIVLGMGFVLDDVERTAFIQAAPHTAHAIKPFMNGQDLSLKSRPIGESLVH